MAYTWALGLSSDRISSITDRTGDNSVIAASSLLIAISAAAAVYIYLKYSYIYVELHTKHGIYLGAGLEQ